MKKYLVATETTEHPTHLGKGHSPFLPARQSSADDRNNPSPDIGCTPSNRLHHPVVR